MKKIITFILIISMFLSFYSLEAKSKESETYFVVTAYYSPLPDQEYYLKGNYKDEIRLNGRGIAGASGRGVYSGMLAAPKNYSFGTKIYLEGLGVGTVEDRGGAIVNAGERGYENDRIDVWMGYGDEGLQRALYWGKRKVRGKILSSDKIDTIDVSKVPSPNWAVKAAKKVKNKISLFELSIGKGSHSSNIIDLQNILNELGLFNGDISGEYDDPTINAVYDFQVKNEIVDSEYDYGAGYFGPKTRSKLKELYDKYLVKKEEDRVREEKLEKLEKISDYESDKILLEIGNPVYGSVSPGVRILQNELKYMGYFDYNDTAIYGDITRDSIIKFQIDKQIIETESDSGAGVFGPKTRESFKESIKNKLFLEKSKNI